MYAQAVPLPVLVGIVLAVAASMVAGAPPHPADTMAVLCSLGGAIGFARTRSKPSLIAGSGVGALYAWAGVRLHTHAAYGREMAAAASLLLLASSAPRFAKGPLPKVLTTTSVLTGGYYLAQLRL